MCVICLGFSKYGRGVWSTGITRSYHLAVLEFSHNGCVRWSALSACRANHRGCGMNPVVGGARCARPDKRCSGDRRLSRRKRCSRRLAVLTCATTNGGQRQRAFSVTHMQSSWSPSSMSSSCGVWCPWTRWPSKRKRRLFAATPFLEA